MGMNRDDAMREEWAKGGFGIDGRLSVRYGGSVADRGHAYVLAKTSIKSYFSSKS